MAEAAQEISLSFRIEGLPPSPNQTKGLHWSKLERIKKEWMERVYFAAAEAKAREHLKGLYETAHVGFHISTGDMRRRDPDNLIWAVCKPTLDALTGLLLTDDSIDHITLSFTFDRANPKGYTVTITGL